MPSAKTIGVLALQGGFLEHSRILDSLGAITRAVRLPKHLPGLDGLIIPGGESTTMAKLADLYGLRRGVIEAADEGLPVWGTCAGMIMIARELTDPYPEPFGLLDIKVSRNWYGRQVNSFEVDLDVMGLPDGPFRGVFIRAPAIVAVGPNVERFASLEDGSPVAVRTENIMATAFHPELADDTRLHRLFLDRLGPRGQGDS